jgi:hypothetical protein
MGVTVLLTVLAAFLGKRLELSPVVLVPLLVVALSPVVGLFAMAGRAGATNAGFLEALAGHGGRRVGGFVVRYALLSVAWSVPLVLVARKAGGWMMAQGQAAMIGVDPFGGAPAAAPPYLVAAWIVIGILAIALLAPAFSLLVATRTDNVGEAFSPGAWAWLLRERRADLPPFLAAYVGGMFLFLLAAIPVLALLLPIARGVNEGLGSVAVVALPLLPFAAAPILLGRLAGAFVAAELELEEAPPRAVPVIPGAAPVFNAGRTHAALAGQARGTMSVRLDSPQMGTRATGGGVPLGVALARAHQLGETDPAAAAAELEAMRAQHPRNPALAAELARAWQKLGRGAEARTLAAEAIKLALSGGAAPIAHDVFMAFASEASELNLDPATYDQIGKILMARKEIEGAAWCFRAASALGGDPRAAQRSYLLACESALQEDAHRALHLYQQFLVTWPDSPLASFARDGAELARRKAMATVT